MARKTKSDSRQADLFSTPLPVADSRPAEGPRRLAAGGVATRVAASPPKAVKRPPEASTKRPPVDLVKTLPWCPLTDEERLDFEVAYRQRVIGGGFRFELDAEGRLRPVWACRFESGQTVRIVADACQNEPQDA